MGETGETPKSESSKRPILPEISEHSKIVEAAKRRYSSLGGVLSWSGFPKEELDEIYVWWDGYKKTEDKLQRFEIVMSSGKLPELEGEQLKKEWEEIRVPVDSINRQIVEFTRAAKVEGNKLGSVVNLMKDVDENLSWFTQALALGEALVATRAENPDDRLMRIKIAQGAWEELLNSFTYAKLHYAAETDMVVTTEDDLEEQKAELMASLGRKPWGVRQTEKNRKVYKGLRKQIIASEYDTEIADNLKIVWDSARGSVPQGTSALDILSANELVLQGLHAEGAFEWDLEELEEAGEGEEE
ncbi:hypothetical protein A2V61_02950 [Candidatus Woesebacteria bacterium RBG_19FT_COMBO_47_8]|nr:MAG: hypothetical protein A2V61_02950 [Candidatus Woesebacteria bacterium RBG_19FT_COMBO_47_8]